MRRSLHVLTRRLAFLAGFCALVGSAGAQEAVKMAPDFEPGRAMLNDSSMFDPFRPTHTESLARALKDDKVEKDTPILLLERGGRHLALLTMQMTYHHVAQGELAGEPWMVSF